MDYRTYLTSLLMEGRATVSDIGPLSEEILCEGDAVLLEFEKNYRLTLPGPSPGFSRDAARWAALQLYRALQFLVYRRHGESIVAMELSSRVAPDNSAESHYSVDLVFRFLPDTIRRIQSANDADPLLMHLALWAHDWPLSSVGSPQLPKGQVDGHPLDRLGAVMQHRTLCRMYVDRVITRGDNDCLSIPGVRERVRGAIGMYPHMAVKICESLRGDNVGSGVG